MPRLAYGLPLRPAGTGEKLLPVMVYIHAGEFRFGTSQDTESDWPWFTGYSNASVLLVTLNSRLGLTGSVPPSHPPDVHAVLRLIGGRRVLPSHPPDRPTCTLACA